MVSGTVYYRSSAPGTLPRRVSSLERRKCDESHIPDTEVIERFGWQFWRSISTSARIDPACN